MIARVVALLAHLFTSIAEQALRMSARYLIRKALS